MLLKIGTYKYHLTISFMYLYDNKGKQLNLLELVITPFFTFVLGLWPLQIYLKLGQKTIIWWTKGLLNVMDKAIYLGRNKNG